MSKLNFPQAVSGSSAPWLPRKRRKPKASEETGKRQQASTAARPGSRGSGASLKGLRRDRQEAKASKCGLGAQGLKRGGAPASC